MSGGLSLYVHVPFCETRCPYCDFNTYARIEPLMEPYVEAVRRELELWGETLDQPRVSTVFLGGGTPSYLGATGLGRILKAAGRAFRIEPRAEITAECNPGDMTMERTRAMAALPLNRLSIGVQSFDDRHIERLGRRHDAREAEAALHNAREAGFSNVNLDLIFGLPGQGLEEWRKTLEHALRLRPEHLSLYCLTLEPGTPLERWVREGTVQEPDPDVAADQYLLAEKALAGASYVHYEISNWALPGRECRHNLTYWLNEPYLGVGPGAHSSLAGHRFANAGSPREYVRGVERWALDRQGAGGAGAIDADLLRRMPQVAEVERLTPATRMAETMMMGLRLVEGISMQRFRRRFGLSVDHAFGHAVDELRRAGLLQAADGTLRLTGRGRLLGNEVFRRLVTPAGSPGV